MEEITDIPMDYEGDIDSEYTKEHPTFPYLGLDGGS